MLGLALVSVDPRLINPSCQYGVEGPCKSDDSPLKRRDSDQSGIDISKPHLKRWVYKRETAPVAEFENRYKQNNINP